MKPQTAKKLFAFIITIMMISAFTQSANAQKKCKGHCPTGYTCVNGFCEPTGYFCICGIRNYGCGTLGAPCVQYCGGVCGGGIVKNTPITNINLNTDSQLVGISFLMEESAKVNLKISDLSGRLLQVLTDKNTAMGEHSIEWNAVNVKGVYLLQMQSAGFSQREKIAIAK